jgi:hypothetical protein
MSFATYSIFPNTTQEANSFNNISDVLTVIPDNTQKLINPRDVRDAIFSNWENTVIRYTSNTSGTQYIGIAREDIKDKLFFGKKSLSGSNILSNTVLSAQPDVDIFFYNTKSDTAPSQNLRIGFIAGSSQSLHTNVPYLEVVQVSGGTPSLGLNLTHNQPFGGDFNFEAGQYGRIGLNSLVVPSVTEIASMVSSPSASIVGDLFVVRSSSGYLEFRTGGSVTSTLGSPGSPTNIFGSVVNVNGYPLEFTDSTPTVQDFGGVPQGSTFSNVPLVEMIRQLLYPYLGPQVTLTITNPIQERNHILVSPAGTNVPFDYTLTKRTADLTSTTIQIRNSAGVVLTSYSGPVLTGSGFISQSYTDSFTFSGAQISANLNGSFTFSVSTTDGTQSVTATTSLNFVYPYFYGFSATTSNTQTIINGLTKLIDLQDDQTVSLAGTGYLYYAYPANYLTLAKIYDGNGFLLWQSGTTSTSWTYSTNTISSPSGIWGGTSYLVFRTTNVVTIPTPSQAYQFNFTP